MKETATTGDSRDRITPNSRSTAHVESSCPGCMARIFRMNFAHRYLGQRHEFRIARPPVFHHSSIPYTKGLPVYRPAPHFIGPYSASGRARRPRRAGISAHRDGSPCPKRFFHSMENFFALFPRYGKLIPHFSTVWKTFFHTVENSARRLQNTTHLSAVRRTWHQRISFGFGRGCFAEITGRFSDGDASRTTRAGLVSARDRPRSVHAEKMPVGFRAAQIQKKSSLPSLRPTCHPHHSTFPPFHFFNIPSFHS